MAKSGHVRHPRRGVSTRSSEGRAGKKPKPVRYPSAGYWFSVIVAGHELPIFMTEELPSENLGEFIPESMGVYVRSELSTDLTEDTVFHEVLHAISQICLPGGAQLSEDQVGILATQLRDTLKRNEILRRGVS